MPTIPVSEIPQSDLEALNHFAETNAGPEMRDLLDALAECIGPNTAAISLNSEGAELTPNQAARRLNMSRTHIYKLLDNGEIPFHRVGRDRRIRVVDIAEFEAQRQRDRRELAERLSSSDRTRQQAIDEIADLL